MKRDRMDDDDKRRGASALMSSACIVRQGGESHGGWSTEDGSLGTVDGGGTEDELGGAVALAVALPVAKVVDILEDVWNEVKTDGGDDKDDTENAGR